MKQIKHSKTDYLKLLLKNHSEGLTANEVFKFHFRDGNHFDTRMVLLRLCKQGCAKRQKEGREHGYWITNKGILRYDYLLRSLQVS